MFSMTARRPAASATASTPRPCGLYHAPRDLLGRPGSERQISGVQPRLVRGAHEDSFAAGEGLRERDGHGQVLVSGMISSFYAAIVEILGLSPIDRALAV